MTWLFANGAWRLKRILIYVLAAWILISLFKWFVLEKTAWNYKDLNRAMKELNKLNEYDYIAPLVFIVLQMIGSVGNAGFI